MYLLLALPRHVPIGTLALRTDTRWAFGFARFHAVREPLMPAPRAAIAPELDLVIVALFHAKEYMTFWYSQSR